MYSEKRVAVVVPALNEAQYVGRVVATIPGFIDFVIVVDDGSTDGTSEAARAPGDERLKLVRHEVNQGLGASIIDGHRSALALGADVSVVMAGDGQMDPAYLTELLKPIVNEGIHFAKGNRFMNRTSLRGMPRRRVVGNAILTFMTKLASGYWHVFDPQNGYTAISRDALEVIPLDRLRKDYLYENSVLCALNLHNLRVRDVPIPAVYGEQVSGIREQRFAFQAVRYLSRAFWRRVMVKYLVWDFHPIGLLYVLGSALLTWAVGFGALVVYWSLGAATASTATVMVSVVPFFLGFQMILTAIILDVAGAPK